MRMVSRKVTAAVIVTSTILGLSLAHAQEMPPVKIAFVDVERAAVTIAEGKARLQALQEWARPRQQELQQLGDEVTNLQGQIASRAGAANDASMADLNRQLKAKQREFEDKQRSARRDFEQRQGEIFKEIGDKMNKVITDYADANRYTAVFILKPNDIAYMANSADITDTIIKLYDEKYPYPPPQGGATDK
jgi:outer membrane protein